MNKNSKGEYRNNMKRILKSIVILILGLFLFIACGKKEAAISNEEQKPIVIGQTFVIQAVEPTEGGTPWSLTTHGLSETVFSLDREGNLVSRYVKELKRLDALSWELTLKEGVKFSDGSPVDADAFVWAMNTIMEKNPLSNATAGKVVFTKEGDYLVKAVLERETQNLKALLTEWTNILFKETTEGYVFTGPYVIEEMEAGSSLTLIPNEYYENHEKRGKVIIKAFQDISSMKLAYEAGELDMAFGITPEIAEELRKAGKIVETIDAGYQYFGLINTKSEFLSDKLVREAINLGLNREDYIKALKGGRVASGAFANYFSFAGEVSLEYNLEKAKKCLEEAGWTLNQEGFREKAGKRLSLRLLTYNSRPDLKTIMQVMLSQLKELGIEAKTSIVDSIDTELAKGTFDLSLYAQHSAPTGDPSYFLNQFFRTGGSKNPMRYSSSEVDALLDKMGSLEFGEESIAIAKQIQKILSQDLPILYLVDPEWNVALSERLKDYKPYSGDYYIVNADLYQK
ncbi:oligopeptide-binding protein oppA [Fusobacterium necrophorum subsp. funduliforme B35]|uniref:Peptide-binding protein n=2 Tax=Fusobacterium necrophorum TaxID=859 RepID=A0A017H6F7_9FUSO|nr:oligopeptide-binding protein oppA [Fusobacterium necrophorum subsp. funduliforme B35]KID48543.1 peptide-binding protein [Fusobacterium necrophorum subsp. funduliforme B35]